MSQHMSRLRKYMRGSAEELEDVRARMLEGFYDLDEAEIEWRDKADFLMQHGYRLRPRFMPGWTPSWEGTDMLPTYCEDSVRATSLSAMDAVRIADGKRVVIKRTRPSSPEGSVARFITSLPENPSNHCVPMLDIFPDDENPNVEYIVMPLLREFYDPPFEVVSEAVDFMKQTQTGLEFMHRSGVAHLDCSSSNIMMDASGMYPKGFHPSSNSLDVDAVYDAKYLSRTKTKSVKYFYIDFEMSRLMRSKSDRRMRMQQGPSKLAPEIKNRQTYDPFPADIYYLGSVYGTHLLEKYSNMEFLRPLIESMVQEDPKLRPSAAQALAQFTSRVSSRYGFSLRWRVRPHKEGRWSKARLVGEIKSGGKETLYIASTILWSPITAMRFAIKALRRKQAISLSENSH